MELGLSLRVTSWMDLGKNFVRLIGVFGANGSITVRRDLQIRDGSSNAKACWPGHSRWFILVGVEARVGSVVILPLYLCVNSPNRKSLEI